jgi:hypothetical protein
VFPLTYNSYTSDPFWQEVDFRVELSLRSEKLKEIFKGYNKLDFHRDLKKVTNMVYFSEIFDIFQKRFQSNLSAYEAVLTAYLKGWLFLGSYSKYNTFQNAYFDTSIFINIIDIENNYYSLQDSDRILELVHPKQVSLLTQKEIELIQNLYLTSNLFLLGIITNDPLNTGSIKIGGIGLILPVVSALELIPNSLDQFFKHYPDGGIRHYCSYLRYLETQS